MTLLRGRVYEDQVTSNSGGLNPDTMRMVNDGLKAALALD